MKIKQEGWSYTDKREKQQQQQQTHLFGFNPIKWNPISSVWHGP